MRILIVEEGLKTGSGHWPVYIGGITSELRKAGDEVDVLVHRDATDSVVNSVGGVRWLSKSCWSDKDCQGFVGGLRHSCIFASDLKRWILANEPYDFVCMLTMRLQHLVAVTLHEMTCFQSSGFSEKTRKTRFLTLFVQGFGEYVEGRRAEKYRRIQGGRLGALKMLLASRGRYFGFHGSSAYPFRGAPLVAWSCFRLLRRGVRKGSFILAAETSQMRGKLENFAKCPVELFPHPVVPGPSLNPVQESKSAFIDSGFSESTTSPSKNPIVIICPGFARYEKGSDLLLGAIEAIVEERLRKAGLEPRLEKKISTESERLHFIMQWPEPFAMPDGRLIGSQADFASRTESFRSGKYLSSSGEEVDAGITVEFLNHNLTAEEYRRLLQKADFVILPYRKSSYHNRVSRVAIEAAMEGVSLIYMAGTWSQEIVELIGTGVEIAEESVSALKVAIFQAIGHSGKLSEAGRIRVRDYHSIQNFYRILQECGTSNSIFAGFLRVKRRLSVSSAISERGANQFIQTKRVGIVSLYEWLLQWDNYGTLLQNFALQKILRTLGFAPFWIRTCPSKVPNPRRQILNAILQLVLTPSEFGRFLGQAIFKKLFVSQETQESNINLLAFNKAHPRYFEEFMQMHLLRTDGEFAVEEMGKHFPEADAYIVGSDNIWSRVTDASFLNFGQPEAVRVAYAVSSPWTKLSRYWYHSAGKKIHGFDALSTREAEGLEVCRKLGRAVAVQTLDPTLLLTERDYREISVVDESLEKDGDFVLGYFVNINSLNNLHWTEICGMASQEKAKLKVVPLQGAELVIPTENVYTPSPGQWLYAFMQARCVVTNSYHGSIFAILMKKPFLVIPQSKKHDRGGERIPNLLRLMGLEERLYDGKRGLARQMMAPIDWIAVEERLEAQRQKSIDFLKNSLSEV